MDLRDDPFPCVLTVLVVNRTGAWKIWPKMLLIKSDQGTAGWPRRPPTDHLRLGHKITFLMLPI